MAVEFDDFPNPTAHDEFGDGLNSKLAALKNAVNLAMQFRGAYDAGTTYDANDVVSYGSGKWHCRMREYGWHWVCALTRLCKNPVFAQRQQVQQLRS